MPKEEQKIEELIEPLKVQEPVLPAPISTPESYKIRTSNLEDDLNLIKTSSTIPTYTPKTSLERIVVYVSGTTYRLYIWDNINKTWRYVALT